MEVDGSLARRIGEILLRRLELAGHLCGALSDSALLPRIIDMPDHREVLEPFLLPDPEARLVEVAQEAVKRFDRLPHGVSGLEPVSRPAALPSFNPFLQSLIDAPICAAEMAAGLRPAPNVKEKLVLINLPFVDPVYFDDALPAALVLFLSGIDR